MSDTNEEDVKILRKQYRCPYFRILVIGRANAGKTTIIEKVCGVAKGTKPFVHNKEGKPSQSPFMLCSCSVVFQAKDWNVPTHIWYHQLRWVGGWNINIFFDIHTTFFKRGMHDIEHQITYPGSNFIFHDSQGFESGATQELEVAWKFIEDRSARTRLKDQLHAIWYLASILYIGDSPTWIRYCIPMDSHRPILATELQFFDKGTGNGELCCLFLCYMPLSLLMLICKITD